MVAIIAAVVSFAIPNMVRARIRAVMLAQMKQVREAAMVTRIDAIKGGRQAVLAIRPVNGRPGLVAWRDDNGDQVADATDNNEALDDGERVIGRWAFGEKVTVANDPARTLKALDGGGRGVVFMANGTANSQGTAGVGQGAFLVSDFRGNLFRVTVQGGVGTVTEEMQVAGAGTWTTRFNQWRY